MPAALLAFLGGRPGRDRLTGGLLHRLCGRWPRDAELRRAGRPREPGGHGRRAGAPAGGELAGQPESHHRGNRRVLRGRPSTSSPGIATATCTRRRCARTGRGQGEGRRRPAARQGEREARAEGHPAHGGPVSRPAAARHGLADARCRQQAEGHGALRTGGARREARLRDDRAHRRQQDRGPVDRAGRPISKRRRSSPRCWRRPAATASASRPPTPPVAPARSTITLDAQLDDGWRDDDERADHRAGRQRLQAARRVRRRRTRGRSAISSCTACRRERPSPARSSSPRRSRRPAMAHDAGDDPALERRRTCGSSPAGSRSAASRPATT